jgi:hypothetical protein
MLTALSLFCFARFQGESPTPPTIKEDAGFFRAIFTSPKGTITVILPNDICQGDTISGTYFPDVKAKDLVDVQVDLGMSHGPPPEIANSPRRKWTVPTDAGPRLSLTVWTPDGTSFGTTYVAVGPKKSKPTVFTIPNFCRIGATNAIQGPFDGDAENTKVKATGVECAVVAESPRNAVVLVPSSMKLGQTNLELNEDKVSAEAQTRMLSVLISSPKVSLNHGESSSVTLKVDGLMGALPNQLPMIILENLTPKVVDFEGRVKHFIIAKPMEDGTYSTTLGVTNIMAGKFAISATVDPGKGTKVEPKPIG